MNKSTYIHSVTSYTEKQISKTIELLEDGATVPFIARYRKDFTGGLDEVGIEQIQKLIHQYDEILKRKIFILESIQDQKSLTHELQSKINSSYDLVELEDLYLPYKKRRKTKADAAKEKGLEPLAKIIMAQNTTNIVGVSKKYISKEVLTSEEAIEGACAIIAEWISENMFVRKRLRALFQRQSFIKTKQKKQLKEDEESQKYNQYFDWEERLSKIPSHRLLAILRAEKEGFIKFKVSIDKNQALSFLEDNFIKNNQCEQVSYIKLAIKDAYKRLLEPSIANETLQLAKSKADDKAIHIFSDNLKQLLLAAPLGEKRILAIDPGYRSGCKIVCIDEKGDLLYNETIYPHPPQKEQVTAIKKISSMVSAYKIDAISIGNGTASRETEFLIKRIQFDRKIQVFVVSEAGASVYSASKNARQEFPNYDVTVRGAVSIGRRLADPLAELVKIDPKSIGVGQYQHDVDANKLKDELDKTVVNCVNKVGVNVNTSSKFLLSYVSGIGDKLAEKIIQYRKENGAFTSREELKNVPRLGAKVFQQAAAFIRVKEGKNPLDNSAVHPEAYVIVRKMAKDLGLKVEDLIANPLKIASINPNEYTTKNIGILGVKDILKELEKPGLDPRERAKVFEFDSSIKKITDLRQGMVLSGIINNITAFGCFVDLGIKENGLIHISQLGNDSFVSDVNEVVKLHQPVQVEVLTIDEDRKRIALKLVKNL